MELQVLLWILGGGFTGTWGLCIFFMNRTDNAINQMRSEVKADITEIRREIAELRSCTAQQISELHLCMKNHHGRLCVIEETKKGAK